MALDVCSGIAYVHGVASGEALSSNVPLSFWGGVNPLTGEVIDRHHPLHGKSLSGKILVVPGGRGSCSGSGVLLELILNGCGPKGMVFEREEDILTLGVIIAEEMFGKTLPVVTLTPADFRRIFGASYASIDGDNVTFANDPPNSAPDRLELNDRGPLVESLELSDLDNAYLEGASGEAARLAMRIIMRMARLQGARRLIDVTQAHVDGCVYTGPGSLLFAEALRDSGGRVAVPTTLNAISVDRRRWRAQGVDPSFGELASRLGDAYTDMGARPTFTCAPYLLETAPKLGEQIAWAESNAVVFSNSVLGARTAKYPDFMDICIALTGRAPLAGPHIGVNREATLLIEIPLSSTIDDSFYPVLGYRVGVIAGNRIPVVVGLAKAKPSADDLKAFGAAFATVSSAPMFHIKGVTPEATMFTDVNRGERQLESVRLTHDELIAVWEELNSADDASVDLVALGNPHFSFNEIERFAALCHGRTMNRTVKVMITTSRSAHDKANERGLVAELEGLGVQFMTDTCWCMISDPVIPQDARTIMTNSGKYAHYGPGLTGRRFHFGGLAACAEAAVSGRRIKMAPNWMT